MKPPSVHSWVLGLAAVLAIAAPLRAEDYRFSTLRLPGEVSDYAAADMDGDGDLDLLVTAIQKRGLTNIRSVSLFLQDGKGAYPEQPDRKVEVSGEVTALLVADVLETLGAELCAVERYLVRVFEVGESGQWNDAPRALLRAKSFFEFASQTELRFLPNAHDLDGNGRDDLVIPQQGNYLCFFQSKEREFRRFQVLAVNAGASLSTHPQALIEAERSLPRLLPDDFDGDGRPDMLTKDGDFLVVYRQHADQRFDQAPSLRLPMTFLQSGIEAGTQDKFDAKRIETADIDGDGKTDLLVIRNQGEVGLFSSLTTELMLFLGSGEQFGRRGADEQRIPHQILRFEGVGADLTLKDMDGDGDKDAAFSIARVDLLSIGAQALADEVRLDHRIFAFDAKARLFSARDVHHETLAIPKRFFDIGRGRPVTPSLRFGYDLDGDGRGDRLAIEAVENDKLVLRGYRNTTRQPDAALAFEREARYRFRVTPSFQADLLDLNGDGRTDVISVVRNVVEVEVSQP